MLRTLSLCTCCRHYPGAAAGRNLRSCTQPYQPSPISLSGRPAHRFFSRLARRSLTLRPAHAHGHQVATAIQRLQTFRHLHACSHVAACTRARSPSRDRYPEASDISSPPCLLRLLPAGADAGWDLHPLENAAFSRRTGHATISNCYSKQRREQPFNVGGRRYSAWKSSDFRNVFKAVPTFRSFLGD